MDGQEELVGGRDPDVARTEGGARVRPPSSPSGLPFKLRTTENPGVAGQARTARDRRLRLHSRTADEEAAPGHALHPAAIHGPRPRDPDERVSVLRQLPDSVDGNDSHVGGRDRANRIPQHPHRTLGVSQHARRNREPHGVVNKPLSHRSCILIFCIVLFC